MATRRGSTTRRARVPARCFGQVVLRQVAAFQALNAADIRGRTLHNACGLGVDAAALDCAVSQEAAKRMSYWRWLVVDEVSMVNARLLAQVRGKGAVSLAARPFFF